MDTFPHHRNNTSKALHRLITATALIFIATLIGGNWFGSNSLCFRWLGCNAGFFGYDIFEHFSAGVLAAMLAFWFLRRYPRFDVFHDDFVKNAIILVALVALIGVGWEILEFSHDHVFTRIPFFYKLAFLRPGSMAQPSNSDTMGDLTFDLLGALTAVLLLKRSGALAARREDGRT